MTNQRSQASDFKINPESDNIAAQDVPISNEDVVDKSSDDYNTSTDNSNTSLKYLANTSRHNITETRSLHPFVHWAQSNTHISLRVNLSQVENLDVKISDDRRRITLSAKGRGAQGLKDYSFALDLFSEVENSFNCHAIERYVLILIKKAHQQANWPRLTKQLIKLPWLRVDFDLYTADDSEDNNSSEDEQEKGRQAFQQLRQQLEESKQVSSGSNNTSSDSNSWYKNLIGSVRKSLFSKKSSSSGKATNMKYDYRKETVPVDNNKNTARQAHDYKKTYLFLYNVVMFIMFLKVVIVLIIKGLNRTVDDDIVQGAAFIVKTLTYTQLLETLHPMLGLVPGGPLMPFTQVIGRLLVNHYISEPEIRLDSAPYVHYLFIVWSSIEIFRYSFYALRVFKVNIKPLTWCRYTLFIPLYPCGGFCESMILLSTITYYEKTGQYSLSLPNAANISFSLPVVLRIYIFILLGPTIYFLMKYMWSQRCKQLKEKTA